MALVGEDDGTVERWLHECETIQELRQLVQLRKGDAIVVLEMTSEAVREQVEVVTTYYWKDPPGAWVPVKVTGPPSARTYTLQFDRAVMPADKQRPLRRIGANRNTTTKIRRRK